MNKVVLTGNLTKDPEFTTTTNGISVARFNIAVKRRHANENGEREADFVNCVVWRNQADNLHKYCHKGDKIGVVGAIQTRSYETQDGTKKYAVEVIADEIEYLNTKKAEGEEAKSEETKKFAPIDDDNLPF